MEIQIEGKTISEKGEPYVIAELGHNHQGEIEKAIAMIKAAKECGCDAVKLQKRDNKNLFTEALYNAPYENENSFGKTYGEHREALEFGLSEYVNLKDYAAKIGITLFATAFDIASADFLHDLDMPAYKIASADIQNIPLIRHVAKFNKPVFISTGGADILAPLEIFSTLEDYRDRIIFLHCTAAYPIRNWDEINLRCIQQLIGDIVGFSDHSVGIAMAPAAYVLGARVFEKHFTLNRTWKGTDHAFSLEPNGMRKYVRDLKRIHQALGDGIKKVYESEQKPLYKMGKGLYYARDISAMEQLTEADIAIKSPIAEIKPYELDKVKGKIVGHNVKKDEPILRADLGKMAEWEMGVHFIHESV